MRGIRLWGPMIAAGLAAGAAIETVAGCGGSPPPHCELDAATPDDAGPRDDADAPDASGPGIVQVNGTFTKTLCPSVNPIGVGPDNGGSVGVSATINSAPQDGGVTILTWTAASGSFADIHAASTTYSCALRGVVKVTVTATLSTGGGCSESAIGYVMCSGPVPGP